MVELYLWLNHLKTSMGVLWDLLLLVVGAILGYLPSLSQTISSQTNRIRIKKRIRTLGSNQDLNIQTICSGVPHYEANHLTLENQGKTYYIGFPKEQIDEIRAKDPDFEIHDDFFFEEHQTPKNLGERMGIPDFEALIHKHRLVIADNFLQGLNGCHFNRKKYGVYSISCTQRSGNDEQSVARIVLYETDYFTHRIMRSIYSELKQRNHPIANIQQGNIQRDISLYNAFTTSIGLNIMLFMESSQGPSVIFSRRAAGTAYSENNFKYNSTVMEGISQTDNDTFQGKVSLQLGAMRALFEELGLGHQHGYLNPIVHLHDVFLEKNYFEVGITASVEIDGTFEETVRDLPGKDKEFEIDQLVPVPLIQKKLNQFVASHPFYSQGLYTLKMVAARKGLQIVHMRKQETDITQRSQGLDLDYK